MLEPNLEIAEAIYDELTKLGYHIAPIDDSAIEPKLGIITPTGRYTLHVSSNDITPIIDKGLWYLGHPILLADPHMLEKLQRQLDGELALDAHCRKTGALRPLIN